VLSMPPRLTSWMRIVLMVVMRSPGSDRFCSAVAVSAVNATKEQGWIAGRVKHQR